MIPLAHNARQTLTFSRCNGVSTMACGLSSLQMYGANDALVASIPAHDEHCKHVNEDLYPTFSIKWMEV